MVALTHRQSSISLDLFDRRPVIVGLHAWNLVLLAFVHDGRRKSADAQEVTVREGDAAGCELNVGASVVVNNVGVSARPIGRVVSCRNWFYHFAEKLWAHHLRRVQPRVALALSLGKLRVLDEAAVIVDDERVSATAR